LYDAARVRWYANVADVAMNKGIPTLVEFFGKEIAKRLSKIGNKADLIAANNVLAHVPDLNDFVAGMKILLKPQGVVTIEFPHLLNLLKYNQFDTIYHEHFSYFSLYAVRKNVENHGLKIFDVEELPTHGGSLRVYLCHNNDNSKLISDNVNKLLDKEDKAGLKDIKTYIQFHENVKETKRSLLEFLIQAKRDGKKVIGYGAPAKGNTLLNYCGIRKDFIDFTVDTIPYKQGLYLPGTHIPIKSPDVIESERPDYIIILPWNFKDEII
jgi:SAM-dependent methyltransferase